MKTAGLDAVLRALKGDSAPISTDKVGTDEGGAFNAAFNAAANNASEAAPETVPGKGKTGSTLSVMQSSESGKALPDNGKELPNTTDNNYPEEAPAESLTAGSLTADTLSPSPFMRAALDKAGAGKALEEPPISATRLSNDTKLQQPGTTEAAPRPQGAGASTSLGAASYTEGALVNYRADTGDTKPILDSNSAKKQILPTTTSVLSPAPEAPLTSINAGERGALADKANRFPTLPSSGTLTSNLTAESALTREVQPGRFAGGNGSSVTVATSHGGAEVTNAGKSELLSALKDESFEAVLDSTAVRAGGLREGRLVNSQGGAPITPDAVINSLAGLNQTARPAESAMNSAVSNLPDIKAGPDAPDFPQEVVARVRMIQGQGQTEARLNLHPAELGRLQIAITSDGDTTRVAFVVDNPQAKEALEQAMPRLREFLQQAGLQLAEGSVSQQGHQGSAAFAQNDSRADDANGNGVEENAVLITTSDQGSDPNRILDAYA
jgi:flagellar hook-length control protein FliK